MKYFNWFFIKIKNKFIYLSLFGEDNRAGGWWLKDNFSNGWEYCYYLTDFQNFIDHKYSLHTRRKYWEVYEYCADNLIKIEYNIR